MGKRMIVLLLAVVLIFHTEAEAASIADGVEVSVEGEEIIYHQIRFDMAGGYTSSGETEVSIQVGENALPDMEEVSAIVPVRTGYIFQGWADTDGEMYAFEQPVLSDLVLIACWAPISYWVRFDGNGGTGEMADQAFAYEEEKPLPEAEFVREGYQFVGWKTGDAVYKGGENVKNLASQENAVVVLEAVWEPGRYKVRFDANGGMGSMADQAFAYDKGKKLSKNKFTRKGYSFAGWNTQKDGKGDVYENRQSVLNLSADGKGVVTLYAMWKGVPYKVEYQGNGATSGSMESSSHEYGTKSRLRANNFKRKGYKFVKWSTSQDGKGETFKDQAVVQTLASKKGKAVTLYAQWKLVNYNITYQTNGGKISPSARKKYNVSIKTFTFPRPTRKGYDFDGWYTDKKWKRRRDKMKQGSTGDLVLYAKWVKCTRQPTANAAKIGKCKATRTNTVWVKASIKNRVASADDYYYLVYVDPISKKPGKMAARKFKSKNIAFRLDTAENQGYVTSMFGIAVKKDGRYHLISAPSFVKNPEKAAENQKAYQPGKTKKGIQSYHGIEEIDACNAKQYFENLTISALCANGTVPYEYNGVTYYFDELSYLKSVARACNKKQVTLTVQVLLDRNVGQIDLINPKARSSGAPFYSWNIYQKRPREKMEAMFCYLGEVFGKEDCYVSNWILGNEVNNPDGWNGAGGMSTKEYFETYAYAFRALYYGVKSQHANAHIFICTDNYWSNSRSRRYSARQLVTDFPKYLNRIQKGLQWNLAYHAYSFPISDTRFWNGSGTTGNVWDTPSITMNNIKVLTDFIQKRYGNSVRIILSEQGFSSVPGQSVQAAALAYGYYIAACNPMIDAFIIRSYDDHPVEVALGLRMGIVGKEAFEVFRYMDSKKSEKYTKRYLKVIGAPSWGKIVPGYQKKRVWKMYRK